MTTPKSHQRRGKTFETDVVKWLRDKGLNAERLPLAGAKDEGDVVVRVTDQLYIVIECKAPGAGNAISLSGWIAEAELEAKHFAEARGIDPRYVAPLLVIKARGKGIESAYAVRKLGEYFV